MDLNTILLLAFIVLMVFCCGGMMMRMGRGKKKPQNESNDSDVNRSDTASRE